MLTNEALLRLIRESRAKAPSGAFEGLLEREINIPKGIRGTASDSQNHLRGFLIGEHDRDPSFPRVLSIEDTDFLGGSFARHVKNWPLDDIDVYLPLDGHGLFYTAYGAQLPYTVASDGILARNPLLAPRWMIGPHISSVKLVSEFAGVLRRHYPEETEVKPNGEAVSIRMSHGETDGGDGLGYDVVPCFLLKPDNTQERAFYLIPDGSGGWIRTNPRLDQNISEQLHKNNEKTFRKAVKLLKFWNTDQLDGALGSYYIELAIARAFIDKNARGEFVRDLPLAVALGFWAVNHAVGQGNQPSWVEQAPPVEPGDLTLVHRLTLSTATTAALEAWSKEQAGSQADAMRAWQRVFGAKFPEPV